MEEKPKNTKRSKNYRGKGFYIAMYSSLGGLLVLALAIGYYNFLTPDNIELATNDTPDFFTQGSIEDIPVGGSVYIPASQPPLPALSLPEITTEQGQALPSPTPNNQNETEDVITDDVLETGEAYEYVPNFEAELTLPLDGYATEEQAQAQEPSFAMFSEGDTLHWPVLGDIVMDFSLDALVYDITLDQWRINDNIAIGAMRGDQVRAAAAGVIYDIVQSREQGQTVVIDHGNGWFTTYSQLEDEVAVSIGDVVNRGQIIGNVGAPSIFSSLLGYHVAFSVSNNDGIVNPNDILGNE